MAANDITLLAIPKQQALRDGAARSSWTVVLLLSLMLAMSLLDRQLLAIIATPVAQALHLRDWQLGLLIGTSFAILYSLMSLPVADGIDRYNRKFLIIAGVTLWSAMTIASAFAASFGMLVVFRSGVAIGEAVLMPAAVSLISDLFPKDKRALPMTVFTSIGAAMTTISFLVGGAALKLAEAITHQLGMAPWRLTFALVGIPGLLLAAAFLLVKEPARLGRHADGLGDGGTTAFLLYLRDHWWFYLPFLITSAVFAMFTYSLFSWVPTIMIRAHGFTAAQASFVFGFIMTPLQVGALYLWPRLAMRFEKKQLHRGVPLALLIASIFVTPFYIVAPLMTNRYLFVGGICLSIITAGAFSVLPAIGFQIFTPGRIRGRITALHLLSMNLVGYGLGPVGTVLFGNAWKKVPLLASWGMQTNPLAQGLATMGLIAAPTMILCMSICVRTSKRLLIVD